MLVKVLTLPIIGSIHHHYVLYPEVATLQRRDLKTICLVVPVDNDAARVIAQANNLSGKLAFCPHAAEVLHAPRVKVEEPSAHLTEPVLTVLVDVRRGYRRCARAAEDDDAPKLDEENDATAASAAALDMRTAAAF